MIGNLMIRGRLVLLALLPIAALVYFAVTDVLTKHHIYRDASELNRAVIITALTSALVHQVQRERGLTAGFIGSRGERFSEELKQQHLATDRQLEKLREQTIIIGGDTYTRGLRGKLRQALKSLDDRAKWRGQAESLQLSIDEVLERYTDINARLLDVVTDLPMLSSDVAIATNAAAIVQLLNAKEKAGLERAVLANAFAAHTFSPGMLGVVVALISAQDAYLDVFHQLATGEQRLYFKERMEGTFVDEVDRMRELAVAGAAGRLEVDPARWFEAMSARIDRLQEVEDRLLADLRSTAQTLASTERHSLTTSAFIALVVMIITALLTYVLMRNIVGQVNILQGTIDSIRRGADLSKRAKITSRDEIGTALHAFNEMLDELAHADIGSRRRLEHQLRGQAEELAEADRRKDQFLAMLAHELRNPLAPIGNVLRTLEKERSALSPRSQQGLAMMERQLGHLRTLVDDLLDVARITHGRLELRKVPMPLTTVLEHAADVVHEQMEEKGHRFHVDIHGAAIYADIDPVRMTQIVTNLLSNAAKYTPEGGEIWLSLERQGEQAVIRVRDNGVGIDANLLPSVFDTFTQAERHLDRAEGGLGIGLSLVRDLTELHGGEVKAFSDGAGKGSCFEVRIPALAERPALSEDSEVAPLIDAGARQPRRILIVEDNVDAATSLASLLRAMGHTVHAAHDGIAAVDVLPILQPDVVILDIGLPEMDGYQVARHLRDTFGHRRILLVALTGYGSDDARQKSRDAGFDHHLVKPVDPNILQRILMSSDDAANAPNISSKAASR